MNTPSAPPPPLPSGTPATTTMPTLGSIVGSVAGSVAVAKMGVSDPITAGTVITGVTALVTGLFHWLGVKFGSPL